MRRQGMVLGFARAGASAPASRWSGGWMLVAQFALTVMLLGATAVLVQSGRTLEQADQVIPLDGLWGLQVSLPESAYGTAEQRRTFFARLDEAFEAGGDVSAGAYATAFPFARDEQRLVAVDRPPDNRADLPAVTVIGIGPRYFEVLGISLLEGRSLTRADLDGGDAVVVNAPFAARFFPQGGAVGRQILLFDPRAASTPAMVMRIAGVSPSVRQVPMGEASPVVYRPFPVDRASDARLLVRSRTGLPSFVEPLRGTLQQWDPDLALFGVQPIQRISEFSRWGIRIVTTLLSAFAVICAVLAGIALFASASFGVERRLTEIGIRMTLGATASQVARAFLGASVIQVAAGTVLGLGGAIAAGAALSGLLVSGVRVAEPALLGSIVALLSALVLLAVAAPLRRALAVDPAVSLRHD
jgi:hypothetical protein